MRSNMINKACLWLTGKAVSGPTNQVFAMDADRWRHWYETKRWLDGLVEFNVDEDGTWRVKRMRRFQSKILRSFVQHLIFSSSSANGYGKQLSLHEVASMLLIAMMSPLLEGTLKRLTHLPDTDQPLEAKLADAKGKSFTSNEWETLYKSSRISIQDGQRLVPTLVADEWQHYIAAAGLDRNQSLAPALVVSDNEDGPGTVQDGFEVSVVSRESPGKGDGSEPM
ncbi:hypothetical protein HKX48_007396 [Thoreauomyces humboldtii]|nr:hypothetical protein HKX48_007396 [Thoreauomyces humboldtii]